MNTYELRVIRPRGRYATIYGSSHDDDLAAIRRAIDLAEDDELVEVWRGSVCVYAGTPEGALALQ